MLWFGTNRAEKYRVMMGPVYSMQANASLDPATGNGCHWCSGRPGRHKGDDLTQLFLIWPPRENLQDRSLTVGKAF